MKIVTASNGKKTLKISKKEWIDIGKKAGWKIAQTINNPDYLFYVVIDGKIESGWEYLDDAKDQIRGNLPPGTKAKIFKRLGLKNIGLNPDNDESWFKGHIGKYMEEKGLGDQKSLVTAQVIPDDGYADGGEPYTDEEMNLMNKEQDKKQPVSIGDRVEIDILQTTRETMEEIKIYGKVLEIRTDNKAIIAIDKESIIVAKKKGVDKYINASGQLLIPMATYGGLWRKVR